MPAQMKRSPTLAEPVNEAIVHPSTMSTKRSHSIELTLNYI
ncbi:hypothetical protein QUA54_31970 [Microcoleus sp. MOSTC5]|nr:hypothetical protein [Microcoleus asticus]